MDPNRVIVQLMILLIVDAKIIKKDEEIKDIIQNVAKNTIMNKKYKNNDDAFNGVYSECFIKFSFPCVQKKTLHYLRELNNLSEVSVFGEYVKFVRLNNTEDVREEMNVESDSEDLTRLIDQAVDKFFDNHVIKFSALGTAVSIPNNVEEFVGRKKRKGGGGGGGGMMGGHDGGHFGHKKMMMMAMMCMKMKLMMMIPAMMGMMGMMSFKGMMFSMMSFMVSKMMLLMKILEKKGGLGGAGGGVGGGDGGWSTGGGSGGGAWMPAGGQDFGGGGGYDANGQWQSRSILEDKELFVKKPIVSYIAPVTYKNPIYLNKMKPNNIINVTKHESIKSRRKRSVIDVIQNSYMYWMSKLLGFNTNNNRRISNLPKYKMVNGIKYVYNPYPHRQQKYKTPKEIHVNTIKNNIDETPIITAADFNKGEIVEGAVESRTMHKKFHKIKDTVNETLDDNPWE